MCHLITLEQLSHFLSAAKYLSFSKAAEEQYKHSTTISKSIQSMESELGAALFIRDNRNIRLTRTGQILSDEGRNLMRHYEDMMKKVRRMGEGRTGAIALVSPFQNSHRGLSEVYREFCRLYPEVDWEIIPFEDGRLHTINDPDIRDRADLAICFRYETPFEDEQVEAVFLNKEIFYIYVASGHPLFGRNKVRLTELADTRFLVNSRMRHLGLTIVDNELRRRHGASLRRLETQTNITSRQAYAMKIETGKYAAMVSPGLFENSGNIFSRIEIEDLDVSHDLVVHWRKDNPNPSLKLFTDMLRQYHPIVEDRGYCAWA